MKKKVGIIGLGKIGLGYDLDDPSGVRTHTKAFLNNNFFKIVLGVDLSESKRLDFERIAQAKSCKSIDEVDENLASEIKLIVIATSTESRLNDLISIVNKFPNLEFLLLEKPIALFLEDAEKIKSKLIENKLLNKVFVNYMRRCNFVFKKLQLQIANGEFGEIQSLKIHYPDQLLNMGSHFIDLAFFLVGNLNFEVKSKSRFKDKGSDFSCDAILSGNNINCEIEERKNLELLISFSKGKILITNSGKELQITLNGNEIKDTVDLSFYQQDVVNHLEYVITNEIVSLSTFESAYFTLELCERIRNFK
jgi:predicted dehydrogenase